MQNRLILNGQQATGPGKRFFLCPSAWASAEEKWTTVGAKLKRQRQQAAWKFVRLTWTFCLRNKDLNKLRFSHRLIDKFSKLPSQCPFPFRPRCWLTCGFIEVRFEVPGVDVEDFLRLYKCRGHFAYVSETYKQLLTLYKTTASLPSAKYIRDF